VFKAGVVGGLVVERCLWRFYGFIVMTILFDLLINLTE